MSKIKSTVVPSILAVIKKGIVRVLVGISKKLQTKYKAKVEAVGSYRRSAAEIGDLDILILVNPIPPRFLPILFGLFEKAKILQRQYSVGDTKASGYFTIGKVSLQIDFLLTTPLEYPFARLYFTGSKDHNILMRSKAKKMGYSLNEHGIKNPVTDQYMTKLNAKLRTEQDIFKFLKMEYLEPAERNKVLKNII